MRSSTAQKQWATARDWTERRSIILELYIRQGKTLEDVVAIMEEKYLFFATPKMYKIRLREWGLRKNRRKAPSSSSVSPPPSTPNGTPVEQQSQPQPQPQPSQPSQVTAPPAETTKALTRQITTPDEFQKTEHLMFAVREFVRSASATQIWIEDLASPVGSRDPSLRWLTQMFCASRLLSRGLTGPAFRAIDACCAEYREIAVLAHPGMFPALVNVLFCLEAADPAVARSFLRYACSLGEAVFPPHHPVRLLAGTFARVGLERVRRFCRAVLEGYKATVQGSVGRHRGAVGRDIATHLLAYQGLAELAEDLARGRGIMDTTLEHWPRWFKVSLESCDPAYLPMVEAFESLLAMLNADVAGPLPKQARWTRDQVADQWEALAEQIVFSII